MLGTDDELKTVLVVDDEPALLDLFADYLRADYRVLTAGSGEAAVEALDPSIDAVLLDRRMPGMSGDEVLAKIEQRGIDCRVAMITSAAPDFDIIELGIDDYLVKPVTRTEVRETIERLQLIDRYTDHRKQLNAAELKRNVLELEKTQAERQESEEFQALRREIERLERQVAALTESLEGTPLERYC